MTHELKILPQYYRAVLEGRKTFEIRKNDRHYCVGDFVSLAEYDPDYPGGYTGRFWHGVITYIIDDERFCKDGYVVFSIMAL